MVPHYVEAPSKLLLCHSSISGRKTNNLARDEKTTFAEFRITVKSIALEMETFAEQNVPVN